MEYFVFNYVTSFLSDVKITTSFKNSLTKYRHHQQEDYFYHGRAWQSAGFS